MISLRLPAATEKRLTTHAKKSGKTRTEIVRRSIEEFLERHENHERGVDIVSDLIAGLPSGPKDLALNRKAYLADSLSKKHAKRHSH